MTTETNTSPVFNKDWIDSLERLGLRFVGLYVNHKPAITWKNVYADPLYRWSTTTLLKQESDRYTMPNMAIMAGPTHIDGADCNLSILDIDSQKVFNRFSIPISQILSDASWEWVTDEVTALTKEFLAEEGIVNGDYNISLLDVLKESGYVTKTRKVYGYHIPFLDSGQHAPITPDDVKSGSEFEIMTEKHLCTMPGSTHREDSDFRYTAIGRQDRIIRSKVFYRLVIAILKDCLRNARLDDDDDDDDNNDSAGIQKEHQEEQRKEGQKEEIVLYDLSLGAVRATAAFMFDYPVKGQRHYFYVYFTGLLFHGRISLKSAFEIVSQLCDLTNDEEKNNRLEVLRLTYQKGKEGKTLKGGPSLFKLIVQTHEEFEEQDSRVKPLLGILRNIWSKDIKMYVGSDLEADKKLSEEVIEILRPDINLLFKDGKDNVYASVNIDDSTQILPIHKSKKFNMWVRRAYYVVAQNTLGGEVLKEVVETLESEALFEGPLKNLELRVSNDPDDSLVVWYDLGDETWDAVRITPQGWRIVKSNDVPIMFRRYQGQLPQAIPVRDYPKDIFQRFMKLLNIKEDSDTRLIYQCYLICILVPKIAKSIFIAHGPQGAAKTSFQDLTRSAIDPHEATNYSPPRSEDELVRQLQHNFLLFYDNLSYIPEWL